MNKEQQRYYAAHPSEWPTYDLVARIAFEHKSFDLETVLTYGRIWEDIRTHEKFPDSLLAGRICGELSNLGWDTFLMSMEDSARIVLIQAYPND